MSDSDILREVQKHLYEGLKQANRTAAKRDQEPGMRPSTHLAFKQLEEAHMVLAAYMDEQEIDLAKEGEIQ